MGRSRGGLTTKIHALVDANGMPIALKLTAGQAHDGRSAADMLDTLGDGDVLLAERAYDSDALRLEMAARGAWANIKPMPTRKRRPASSAFLYRYRNLVERFFNKALLSLSKGSSTSEPSPPATTSATTTSSPQSNSPASASGCGIMSR